MAISKTLEKLWIYYTGGLGTTGQVLTSNGASTAPTWQAAGAGSTDPEIVRDTMATALVAGSGISISVDDPGDTITITASGGSGLSEAAVLARTSLRI